jgi:hypothetical protein
VPHVYWHRAWPYEPELCLYDPALDEWHRGELIAATIIPWTIDWLVSYEGWRVTGIWQGGGRDHHQRLPSVPCPRLTRPVHEDISTVRAADVEIRRHDLEAMTSTSAALMVAASSGSPNSFSWQELRNAFSSNEASLDSLALLRSRLREEQFASVGHSPVSVGSTA